MIILWQIVRFFCNLYFLSNLPRNGRHPGCHKCFVPGPGPVNNYSTLKFTFPAVAATTDVPYASSLVNPPLKIYCRYCVRALLTRDLFATVSVTPQRYDGLIDAPTPADHTVKIPTQYIKGTDWQHCVIACVLPKGATRLQLRVRATGAWTELFKVRLASRWQNSELSVTRL